MITNFVLLSYYYFLEESKISCRLIPSRRRGPGRDEIRINLKVAIVDNDAMLDVAALILDSDSMLRSPFLDAGKVAAGARAGRLGLQDLRVEPLVGDGGDVDGAGEGLPERFYTGVCLRQLAKLWKA